MMINRMNDRLFKFLFGDAQHKERTIALINAVFEFEGTELIEDIAFDERQMDPQYSQSKLSILDIRGTTKENVKINIELQAANTRDFPSRAMYYWSKLYGKDLMTGQEYESLTRTVSINLLGFRLLPYEDFHSMFSVYNIKKSYKLTDQFEMHFLEIPKWPIKSVKEMKRLDRWIAYFSNSLADNEMEEIALMEPEILDVLNAEQAFMRDPKLAYEYEMREKELRDYYSNLKTFEKKGFNKGWKEGIEKGMEKGIEKGIEKGMEKGVEKVAASLIKMRMDVEAISQATGLTPDKIEALKRELL